MESDVCKRINTRRMNDDASLKETVKINGGILCKGFSFSKIFTTKSLKHKLKKTIIQYLCIKILCYILCINLYAGRSNSEIDRQRQTNR